MNISFNETKLQFTITMVLVLFISVVGFTYAYFAVSVSNNTIAGSAATVNLTLAVNKVFPLASSTNTGVMVPQRSISGNTNSPLSVALKNGCVDGNSNIVCHVYEITIQNIGGTATQVVDGMISFYGNSAMTVDISTVMPNLSWKLITSASMSTPNSSVLGTAADLIASSEVTVFSDDLELSTNVGETYYIIVWLSETDVDQTVDEGNSFFGMIEFESSNGTGVTSTFSP